MLTSITLKQVIVTLLLLAAVAAAVVFAERDAAQAANDMQIKFKQVRPIQFIAALGEPDANSGVGAEAWGLWPVDPGPRGVRLSRFDNLQLQGGVAPAGWTFDNSNWWLEENGLIMEPPQVPLAPGNYLVTGDRAVTTVLTVYP